MQGQIRELLMAQPAWSLVLKAYEDRIETVRNKEPEFSGWVDRLREVDQVPPGQLAPIHGKLIAHGLLEFTLDDRAVGVCYRLSTLARQVLGDAAESGNESEAIPA